MNTCVEKNAWLAASYLTLAATGSVMAQTPDPQRLFVFSVPGGYYTSATDVDKSGRIIGSFTDSSSARRGFVRQPDGEFIYLDVNLPGSQYSNTVPRAISEIGTIAGSDEFFQGAGPFVSKPVRSWVYDLKSHLITEIAYPGAFGTQISDMNESGVVVGWATQTEVTPGDKASGFSWANGVFKPISIPGADSTMIMSINAKGQMAGKYYSQERDGRLSAPTQFIMEPDGSYKIVEPKHPEDFFPPTRPWEIWTLGNNGDYAGGCFDGAVHHICYYRASSQETKIIEFGEGSGCSSSYINIESIKSNLTTGRCSSGQNYGFVATKKTLLKFSVDP